MGWCRVVVRAHVSACAGRKLPTRGLTPLQCRRHFAEREIEHLVQQEGSPLQRRQPLQCQQQRYGQILCQSVRSSGASAAVSGTGSGSQGPTYSSRRARADVSISRQIRVVVVIRNALGSETWSRSAACQRRYVSCTAVLGVSHRPKHAVCETEQAPPVRLESRGWIRSRACGAHGVRTAISAGAGTRP